jgi:hypothetical protein
VQVSFAQLPAASCSFTEGRARDKSASLRAPCAVRFSTASGAAARREGGATAPRFSPLQLSRLPCQRFVAALSSSCVCQIACAPRACPSPLQRPCWACFSRWGTINDSMIRQPPALSIIRMSAQTKSGGCCLRGRHSLCQLLPQTPPLTSQLTATSPGHTRHSRTPAPATLL